MLIRECTAADVERVEEAYPTGAHRRHAQTVERQQTGECTFLVAWDGEESLGHGEVVWQGCKTTEVRATYPECPEINGLRVYRAEMRGRGIGTALIRSAEDRARERGFQWIGLGVADDNPSAARLYERLGYDAGIRYTAAWSYEDDAGVKHVIEDPRTFMVRDLTT
ncbi:N-acetyltransferase family protein [Actinopolymorpha pittospori]